jgi:hypothetical protein
MTAHDRAGDGRVASHPAADLNSFEIALTEHELHLAYVLEFDPEAGVPDIEDRISLSASTLPPVFLAVPGAAFSHSTWVRLALSYCAGRPAESLATFLVLRARRRR